MMDIADIMNVTNGTDLSQTTVLTQLTGIAILIMYILVLIFGVVGNGCVILAVVLSKKLQTLTNIFIVNQSFSDLLSCSFVIFSFIEVSTTLCRISILLVVISVQCSVFNIGAIALNRYILITASNSKYRRFFTSPIINCIMVVSVWCLPIAIDLIPTFGISFGDEKEESRLPKCRMLFSWPVSAIHSYIIGGTVFIPLMITLCSYILILRHINRHFSRQRAAVENEPGSSKTLRIAEKGGTMNRLAKIDYQQLEVTKNLFIVVVIFCLLVIPNAIARLFPDNIWALLVTGCFILASAAVNPIIYLRKHPHFRIVLVSMLKCNWTRIPEKSHILQRILGTTTNHVS